MSAIAREKTSEMSRLGAGKCPHFRIARVRNSGGLFQSFPIIFMLFARGLALVRISVVSVIARCPESRLYVEPSCANVDCHVI